MTKDAAKRIDHVLITIRTGEADNAKVHESDFASKLVDACLERESRQIRVTPT
jgi:hypothetical protein